MALLVIITMAFVQALNTNGEMALANITRFASGDLFSLVGKYIRKYFFVLSLSLTFKIFFESDLEYKLYIYSFQSKET